ncbi:aminotransferase class V-fold PLP-dependent enzyme [Clostridium perfringens]|uniref:pyridoxal-phosphate-dependent aminotransferase family protein n=1 Tax=Clostridium perfringens TaxID=1502 RepID=UPI001CC9423C|nr:aminotransferase class V-fold PLP-dependent enzyme [Clostridium perfringens]EHK2328214.1 alanine--glyoxylate aminotransferase family protein [Clostridium perfringens]MDM0477853.1 aminotransferase class V-fold PLP-dependent enzyme [Clostridium perfringens]MDM0486156.1 aminotransferase class V-fold PLP-dependent enzyme [Clostridium perfringens]UBK29539.1 aminotransferase class V-fold PLP-dependent enzyme [Clostridium perfringens]
MNKDFLNFSVGPVLMEEETLSIGKEQIPYFRTDEFSKIMIENERLIKRLVNARNDSRVVFLTTSGTGAMEATVMNTLTKEDRVLVINGGSFGARFSEICDIHEIPYVDIKLNYGEVLTKEHLDVYKNQKITALLVNIHETSTGMLYDVDMLSNFCKEKNCLFIVDAISSFLADEINMKEKDIDILITSSQKALALPPGISIIVLNEKSINRIKEVDVRNMYFNFNSYLKNGERGQTPFTPAVGILLQLNARLKSIDLIGIKAIIENTKNLAEDFRSKVVELPFEIVNKRPSNAVTAIKPLGKMKAYDIFEYLKDNYNIFVCPNGGELRDKLFRVGHIGNLNIENNDILINALKDMNKKGLF